MKKVLIYLCEERGIMQLAINSESQVEVVIEGNEVSKVFNCS